MASEDVRDLDRSTSGDDQGVRRDELAGLIEAHGVNIVLFPSIGAETFSCVVAEAMHLQLPIVAFDRDVVR